MGFREADKERELRAARRRQAEAVKRIRFVDLPQLIERKLNDLKRAAVKRGYPCSVDEALDPLSPAEIDLLRAASAAETI